MTACDNAPVDFIERKSINDQVEHPGRIDTCTYARINGQNARSADKKTLR